MVCDSLVRADKYLRHSLASIFSLSFKLPFSVPGRQSRKVYSMVASMKQLGRQNLILSGIYKQREVRKRSNKTENKYILLNTVLVHVQLKKIFFSPNILSPHFKGYLQEKCPDSKISFTDCVSEPNPDP
jgi:hypothetical protein